MRRRGNMEDSIPENRFVHTIIKQLLTLTSGFRVSAVKTTSVVKKIAHLATQIPNDKSSPQSKFHLDRVEFRSNKLKCNHAQSEKVQLD